MYPSNAQRADSKSDRQITVSHGTAVPHSCKGDATSEWEIAIFGCQNSVTPEPID